MNIKQLYWTMPIRTKLLILSLIIIIPSFILTGIYTISFVKKAIQTNIERELSNSTASISNMIQTTAAASMKNYLRAVAEMNLFIVSGLYKTYENKESTRESAIQKIRQTLLNQKIGKTGYIYCINSKGIVTIHPRKQVEGQQYLNHAFIHEQIKKKTGYIEYNWKNPEDKEPRPKALYMSYFEPLDMIISVSTYQDEFTELINIDDFKTSIMSLKFGKTGYAFVVDKSGKAIIHPGIEGLNVLNQPDLPKAPLLTMLREKTGNIRYLWKNPKDSNPRWKLAFFNYIPQFDWIIGSSSYEEEVFSPVLEVSRIITGAVLISSLLSIILIFFIGTRFMKRLNNLKHAFVKGMKGDYSIRSTPDSGDEIGQLAQCFNRFMERFEDHHLNLLNQIQEKKRAESKLKDNEQKYRQLFELESDAIFLVQKQDRKIIEANTSAFGLYGYSSEELVSWDFDSLYAAANPGKTSFLDLSSSFSLEYHCKKNGEFFPVEIKTCSFEWKGETIEVYTVRDLTTLARAEEKQLLLSMAIEQLREIIIITDTDANIRYVNSAFEKITGYNRNEIIGKNPRMLKSGKHDEIFYEIMWNSLIKGESWKGRLTNSKKDGSLYIEDVIISPLSNAKGEIISYVAAKRDVSREVKLENQLLRSQKMEAIGTLAGGIAHDFNNILGGIIGYTDLAMKNPVENTDKMKYFLSKILETGDRAKRLVQQILTFSRQGTGELKPVQPGLIIQEVIQLMRASLPATIEIKHKINTNAFVMADSTNMHQVFMNLCTNAGHAMKESGGILELEVTDIIIDDKTSALYPNISPGPYVKLIVSDTGKGIAPEVQDRIFEPFYTTKGKSEGTGLGLSVVHGIVKRSSGDISVSSSLGRGTVFTILLPAVPDIVIQVAKEKKVLPQGTERILYVDDEDILVEISEAQLKSLGYRVTALSDPKKALEIFKQNPSDFNIVITDLSMPGISGDKLAQAILTLRNDIPVIICTGFSEMMPDELIEQLGIKALLMKPVIIADLAYAVRKALDGK